MFQLTDVRYALRLLRRSPFFSLLTMAVLSGGLAVSIFTFSFLHTAMLKPLPLASGERVVRIEQRTGATTGALDAADVAVMRPAITTLSGLGSYATREVVIGDDQRRKLLGATIAEWNIFELTRTRPALGRGFRPGDQAAGAEPVIVLGDRTWKATFGGDPGIVDKQILVSGRTTRVIGVMPAGYGFPVAAEAWIPISDAMLDPAGPDLYAFSLYGRLADGAGMGEAQAELTLLLDQARQNRSALRPAGRAAAAEGELAKTAVTVETFPMAQIGEQGPLVLAVLNVLAGLILLLSCINAMNLLLARSNERARETAVRLALGATRARLIVQSMWESALLCLIGGALAIALAGWALDFINRWAQQHLTGNLAFWWVWGLDRSAVMASIVFIAATIGILGAAVARRATSTQIAAVINNGGARSGGRREGRLARILVVMQVATVSVLMFFGVMSGIVAYRVATVDLGYDTRSLLIASLGLSDARYTSQAQRDALYQATYDSLSASPAVQSVLLRSGLAEIGEAEGGFEIPAGSGAAGAKPRAYVQAILGSLETLGISATEGRLFDSRDDASRERVALVSAALAAQHWPGDSPVGKQLRLSGLAGDLDGGARWLTVVGVVGDVLLGNPLSRERSALAIYVPMPQHPVSSAAIVYRHNGDAAAAEVALHRTLAEVDPQLAPPHIGSFDDMIGKTTLMARATAKLFGLCFGFALLLALSGTYGLMARSIGQRTQEIGVRRALGASNRKVTQLLLAQGGRQLGIGVVFALPVMLATGWGFAKFFPIGALWAIGGGALVVATIVSVVLAATYIPARRVIGLDLRDALWRD